MEQAYKSPAGLIVATAEIPLTRGGYVTVIDDGDSAVTDGRNWHPHMVPHRNTIYACAVINGKHTLLHRLLASWDEVDHADGDGLNNCRSNLRDGTGLRNKANRGRQRNNTSGFKGVSLRQGGKWGAFIKVNRKQIYLGAYATPEEAADAYDQAAVRYFGEYARTNAMLASPQCAQVSTQP